MPCHGFGFVAEEDALVSVSDGAVIGEGVVRVLVADGDTGLAVVNEGVVFKTPVPDAPAQEKADAAVPDRPAVADGG